MRSSKRILDVSNLRIERNGTVILHDVSWQVQRGQHWAILGANGSGKTSLLSALTGYLMPTAGDISLLGQRYGESDWRELRRRIGIVSSSVRQMMADDEPALETVVSGKYAMIDFWGRPRPADEREARRFLAQVECSELIDRRWGVLSQGERQRVLIGRALMAKPQVLILDEPCAGLDPAAREQFLGFVERIGNRRDGPTLILVTHHVEEIMPAFSHVLLLKNGRVGSAGVKADVLTSRNLSDTFTARARVKVVRHRYQMTIAPGQRRDRVA
ncbi:MAG TPA: ABC transporter ATP-binding protein [Verrucomicrobiae bacterium]|nr:ABC transporter ATP-binding protein [Verrucomicrobiae bacterium]